MACRRVSCGTPFAFSARARGDEIGDSGDARKHHHAHGKPRPASSSPREKPRSVTLAHVPAGFERIRSKNSLPAPAWRDSRLPRRRRRVRARTPESRFRCSLLRFVLRALPPSRRGNQARRSIRHTPVLLRHFRLHHLPRRPRAHRLPSTSRARIPSLAQARRPPHRKRPQHYEHRRARKMAAPRLHLALQTALRTIQIQNPRRLRGHGRNRRPRQSHRLQRAPLLPRTKRLPNFGPSPRSQKSPSVALLAPGRSHPPARKAHASAAPRRPLDRGTLLRPRSPRRKYAHHPFRFEIIACHALLNSERTFMIPGKAKLIRCHWAKNELNIPYHDQEWGVSVHDDNRLFEFVILEGAQAGLSWDTILKKRARYREVFDQFDAAKVARYDKKKIRELLRDAGIIRNRLKIDSTITNARAFLEVQKEFGSFDAYIWRFVGGQPRQNARKTHKSVPAKTPESDAMSKDLQKRGFRFVGSTICYAFMQATGMVNDHLVACFRHKELSE